MGKNLGVRRSANLKAVEAKGLPVPRLQFRWEQMPPEPYDAERMKMVRAIWKSAKQPGDTRKTPTKDYVWQCHYELVLALDTNDIRNPHEYKKPGELTVALGGCKRKTSEDRPPVWGGTKVDTPFRDGAHAGWDGLQLGRPPVYAICGDVVTKVEMDWSRYEERHSEGR